MIIVAYGDVNFDFHNVVEALLVEKIITLLIKVRNFVLALKILKWF